MLVMAAAKPPPRPPATHRHPLWTTRHRNHRCGRTHPDHPQKSPLGSSSSLLASSSTFTSLKVTTRTVFANRAGR